MIVLLCPSCIGRYWEMVQRLKIKQFYTAPTAIRMLMAHSDSFVTKYDRSSLRSLGSGERISLHVYVYVTLPSTLLGFVTMLSHRAPVCRVL